MHSLLTAKLNSAGPQGVQCTEEGKELRVRLEASRWAREEILGMRETALVITVFLCCF